MQYEKNSQEMESIAGKILKEVFSSVPKRPRHGQADFVIKKGDSPLIVEVKGSKSPRISELEGKLALALLQTSRWGAEEGTSIVMIGFPKLGPKILAHTKKFMTTYAPQAGWCVFDMAGAYHFEMNSKGIVQSAEPTEETKHISSISRGSIFSDLNRWMLKLLLLSDVSPNYWGGPSVRINSPSELCEVANVSSEKAYSFVRSLSAAGFVQHDQGGIRIIRREELLRTWFRHQLTFQHQFIPVRWLFGPISRLTEVLLPLDPSIKFAVTGFEACQLLGVLHAPVNRREVYLHGDINKAMAAWNLSKCETHEADLFLAKMPHAQSITRGMVHKNNLPVVDILEAALSVIGQLPRGAEQAHFIITQLLGWEVRIDD